ncbi:hypothetical protein AVEN_173821-1 [Araneus ventricosus]|uniref:Uncharacterized protein n=1 Tax=Araneus ventricosus TaxID=182803 RepID=A0A4Y2L8H6_ARAVE|nr:hypothetical protein AVEN_173821-1 [Araneus ventricosus]
MELKCRNHLTTAEARRIYNQSAKVNYASAVKAHAPMNDIEGQINGKMEVMLLKMNEKIESVIQTINAKMEQQANQLVELFERLVESLLQNFSAINKLGGETISPSRKKKRSINFSKHLVYQCNWMRMLLVRTFGFFFSFLVFRVFKFFPSPMFGFVFAVVV